MLKGGGVPGLTNASNVAITGGTIAGVSGVSLALNGGGLPFISLSSGSVAANGAISAITALPRIYPAAWCYFPANALATVLAAGWYYCTFSSTTAGVAFLNTYTSGASSVPASPTAVTDGKGAFTGDTGEEFGLTLSVPALTATSAIKMVWFFENTNNANVKTYRVRLSGNGGTIFIAAVGTSIANGSQAAFIQNTGATGNQFSAQITSGLGANVQTDKILGTVATSSATTLVFSLQKATATDNAIWYTPSVELAL